MYCIKININITICSFNGFCLGLLYISSALLVCVFYNAFPSSFVANEIHCNTENSTYYFFFSSFRSLCLHLCCQHLITTLKQQNFHCNRYECMRFVIVISILNNLPILIIARKSYVMYLHGKRNLILFRNYKYCK